MGEAEFERKKLVTQYEAIHENGPRYDDDVGGPMFVDGRDGVELEPLDADQDAAARRAAATLFQAIEASRDA